VPEPTWDDLTAEERTLYGDRCAWRALGRERAELLQQLFFAQCHSSFYTDTLDNAFARAFKEWQARDTKGGG
jgi:hypothetical protein